MADPDLVTMNYYVNISVMIFCRNYRSKALNEINTTISWPGFTTASAQSTGISEILVTVHKGFIASPLFIYIYTFRSSGQTVCSQLDLNDQFPPLYFSAVKSISNSATAPLQ